MATRYWVGGAGNWSSTTKWSETSGGVSGASVPTSVDDVVFDANSGGKFTATVDTAQSVNSITITPSAAVGVQQIALSARLTTNNLTTTGTAGNNRIWFRGNTYSLAEDFVINGTVSISDCDFRDIYVIGTSAPISGTRIGDLRGCSGITFSTPKTVYCVSTSSSLWSALNWSNTVGGAASTNYYPLAQDIATFVNTGLSNGATVTWDAPLPIPYVGTIDMSARTLGMTMNASTSTFSIYGDWKNGTGTLTNGSGGVVFSGRNTQTITSAGKAFIFPITIDSYEGSVQLADAINVNSITVTNGTLATNGYAVTAGSLFSDNTNVRTIDLGASIVTLTSSNGLRFSTTNNNSVNLNFIAGTSTIICTAHSTGTLFGGGGSVFYNVSFTANTPLSTSFAAAILGNNTYNNLSITKSSSSAIVRYSFSGDSTVIGTFTCAGGSAVGRIFLQSNTFGTTCKFTTNILSSTDCDFRDIKIEGSAAGSSTTRTGDCGGNSGIVFPSPKTVYWNLAGAQGWTATGWASVSGGTPDINNFPLAQDTAVFDNVGSVTGAISTSAGYNIGSIDASARTTAMTFNAGNGSPLLYGNWTMGSGVTLGTTGTVTFSGRGTTTITNNGTTFNCSLTADTVAGTVQLADALIISSTSRLTLTSGTFDAISYNVTIGNFSAETAGATLKMGSGTWTLSGTGGVWYVSNSLINFYKGTANIVLSNNTTVARTFGATGTSYSYNKLTIGGDTSTSITTILGNNTFTELASTKTVAHTVALGTTTQTFGAWTVTGTAGNVVTVTGTGTAHVIAGPRVSGIDYLAFGSIGFSPTSPGEFYAGYNSSATNSTILRRTAPTPVTRYWRGGTGTWNTVNTTNWSDTSGGFSGASVPTSVDDVIFDSASNAAAYTVNCTATILRCKSLTISGPASGNVTWAGTAPIAMHGSLTLPATGLTRTYTGAITLTGSAIGNNFTTNGVSLSSGITVNGIGCSWDLGSALNTNVSAITVTNGTFNLLNFNLTAGSVLSNGINTRSINFGSGTVTLNQATPINFGTLEINRANLTITTSTSQINLSSLSANLAGNNQTFYNVDFTSTTAGTRSISGNNTFNNLTIVTNGSGMHQLMLYENQIVSGIFSIPGSDTARRGLISSSIIGTPRTITVDSLSVNNCDFRDIIISGGAAGTVLTTAGDCGGNTGITFPSPKTVYRVGTNTNNWAGLDSWAETSGGVGNSVNFPLAQDTAVIDNNTSASTLAILYDYNIGSVDCSNRTSAFTLNHNATAPIYGSYTLGSGVTVSGISAQTFAGRGTMNFTSAGKTITFPITINAPGGSFTLQDAISVSRGTTPDIGVVQGTFDANGYTVTTAGQFASTGTLPRTVAIGSATWLIGGSGWDAATATNLTVTGTGTISLTSSAVKGFAGGGIDYSGITLNQGGSSDLLITGNNTLKDITSTYSAIGATSINFGSTTQKLQQFTASGGTGKVLSLTGTSAASPANLILTGASDTTANYLNIDNVRMYSTGTGDWYVGTNSVNGGSYGAIFTIALILYNALSNFFAFF